MSAPAEGEGENPKDAFGSAKPDYWCVPPGVLYDLGAVMQAGAAKYGRFNWRKTRVRASVYVNAMRRHPDAWTEGEDIDPDSGFSHLAAVLLDALKREQAVDDRRPNGV